MAQQYNNPPTNQSTVGEQINEHHYIKKALTEARRKAYFSQLAMTKAMPKHMGKTVKLEHFTPIIHDANINDQGIDANGVTTTRSVTITIKYPNVDGMLVNAYAEGEGADAAAALAAAKVEAESVLRRLEVWNTDYATTKTELEGRGWTFDEGADVPARGNLYGSSRDVGTIRSKMPALTENGGRVNRVGFKRTILKGTLERYGIFMEYTDESLWFDTNAELMMHTNRLMIDAAYELTEDLIQNDLLNSAGNIRFAGAATSVDTISHDNNSVMTYKDIIKASIDLDNKFCPKDTKIITGTRLTDTKTIPATRIAYIGPELVPTIMEMVDSNGNPAFISVEKYAAGTKVLTGELGSVGYLRFIVNPHMQYLQGAGAAVTDEGYYISNGKYDVFPVLIVGSESFSTIGFQTSGRNKKFTVYHKKPGKEMVSRDNPYGTEGIMSINFFYGFLCDRPERITLIHTLAKM